jgi:hypothetical protein
MRAIIYGTELPGLASRMATTTLTGRPSFGRSADRRFGQLRSDSDPPTQISIRIDRPLRLFVKGQPVAARTSSRISSSGSAGAPHGPTYEWDDGGQCYVSRPSRPRSRRIRHDDRSAHIFVVSCFRRTIMHGTDRPRGVPNAPRISVLGQVMLAYIYI